MAQPLYNELRLLAKNFAEAKNIKDRRKAGEALCHKLGSARTRALLVSEANGYAEVLRGLWRMLASHLLAGLKHVHSKKNKLAQEDMRIFKRFLDICITAKEGFENELSSGKLTKKHIRSIIEFVLNLLYEVDEGTHDNPDFEVVLLELLSQICNAREFVVHFRPQNEMRVILEVAERRIVCEADASPNIVLAAQIVYRLFSTSATLHFSLDYLLPGFVKVVATWCRDKIDSLDHTLGELEYLMAGLAILLNSNPEQAVAPMSRHGGLILKFAKRRYRKAGIRQSHKDREAMNEYFMAHM
jgi:hypothetical protein